jgi:hypothetical protein
MVTWTLPQNPVTAGEAGHLTDHERIYNTLSQLVGASTDWVNLVTQFGADPSGSGDSTTAVENAVAAGYPIYVPFGTYKTSAQITLPPGTVMFGPGAFNGRVTGDASATWKPSASFSGSSVFLSTSTSVVLGPRLFGFSFDGSNLTSTVDALYSTGNSTQAWLENLYGVNMTGYMINMDGTSLNTGWRVRGVFANACAAGGFFVSGQTDATWTDVECLGCGGTSFPGWEIKGPANTHFTNIRSEWSGAQGYLLTGAWNSGQGAGGCTFNGISTDRNTLDGVLINATGTSPVIFNGLMLRRDGRNGGTGGGGYSCLNINDATIPVIVNGITTYPGVDDNGSGTSSPQYGVSVTGSSYVEIPSGYIHAATAAINNGGSNTVFNVGSHVITATGTTGSPSVTMTPYLANLNAATVAIESGGAGGNYLLLTGTTSGPGSSLAQISTAASGDNSLGIRVTGDTNNRFKSDSTGLLQWGPGNAGQDTNLYRSATGVLATDGLFASGGGFSTSASAPVVTPSFANGTAAQLSNTARDFMVYLQVGTPGTGFVVAIGPTSTPSHTVFGSATPAGGELVSFRVPAGWYVEWSGSSTTIAHQLAVGC